MSNAYDVIVIGAGVIGTSVAYHLARFGAGRVLVVDRLQIGAGTTAQSSGILRTHYSVVQNVELARRSWEIFRQFAGYLEDEEATAGLVECGYLICAPQGPRLEPLRQSLASQRKQGIRVDEIDGVQARGLLPIARFDDMALIGYEPQAGFADAYLVATSFARAARRRGVRFMEGVTARRLLLERGTVLGIDSSAGRFDSPLVISTQNIWSCELQAWTGLPMPVKPERHRVLALQAPDAAYRFDMPVFKDMGSAGMLYYRSYGGRQMLVSEGTAGQTLPAPDITPGDIPMDYIAGVGEQVAQRFPHYEHAGVASAWTGVYDVTPDWNPVLGPVPGIEGLVVGYGFSGHGFKLSPAVGRVLAQCALRQSTDVSLQPYAYERFAAGQLLTGLYGAGAVS